MSRYALVVGLCVVTVSLMAAPASVELKTVSGDIVEVELAELRAAHERAAMSERIATNSKGAQINDDGSVTITSPTFKHNGEHLPFSQYVGVCRFLGYGPLVDRAEHLVDGDAIVLKENGTLDRRAPPNPRTQKSQIIISITCAQP